jgi:hypothetical protein
MPEGADGDAFHRPLTSAVDLGILLAALAVGCEHTINFDVDARAVINFASGVGTDATAIGRALGSA